MCRLGGAAGVPCVRRPGGRVAGWIPPRAGMTGGLRRCWGFRCTRASNVACVRRRCVRGAVNPDLRREGGVFAASLGFSLYEGIRRCAGSAAMRSRTVEPGLRWGDGGLRRCWASRFTRAPGIARLHRRCVCGTMDPGLRRGGGGTGCVRRCWSFRCAPYPAVRGFVGDVFAGRWTPDLRRGRGVRGEVAVFAACPPFGGRVSGSGPGARGERRAGRPQRPMLV